MGDNSKQKLCWATHRDLLHIFVEHLGATSELFCNIMNTFHRFETRRTLGIPRGYAAFNDFLEDGTDEGAYVGVVYANPPFDGQEGGRTVARTLDLCQQRASSTVGFRAVAVVPMSPATLVARAQHPRARVLLVGMDNTVPFVPDGVWYGKARYTGRCYRERHTQVVVIMYESEDLGDLTPVVWDNLYGALASWYAAVIPEGVDRERAYEVSLIPRRYFEALGPPPLEWEFWRDRGCVGEGRVYKGAVHDSQTFGERPVWDVIRWDPALAMLGVLPASFDRFLRINGHTCASVGPAKREIAGVLRGHLRRTWLEYTSSKAGRVFRDRFSRGLGGAEPPPPAASEPLGSLVLEGSGRMISR